MKELIIETEKQEDLLNLSTYRSVTYVQNLIKSKVISKDKIMEIIYNSGLFKKMKNQDTRLTQFWGNPEFACMEQFREELEIEQEERILEFLYQLIFNGFSENEAVTKRKNRSESLSIFSYFLKNIKGLILTEILFPKSQEIYPLSTRYTMQLLGVFHCGAGYDVPVSEYCIEDICDYLNAGEKVIAKRRVKYGREKKKEDKYSLWNAYTLWKAYSQFGDEPRFKSEEGRKEVYDKENRINNKFSSDSISSYAKDIIKSDNADYNYIMELGRGLFTGEDFEFFETWFNESYFHGDCFSTSKARQCNKDGVVKTFAKYLENGTWETTVGKRITAQRKVIISALMERGVVDLDTLSKADNKSYTSMLIAEKVYEITGSEAETAKRCHVTKETVKKRVKAANTGAAEKMDRNSGCIDFQKAKDVLNEKYTYAENLFFKLDTDRKTIKKARKIN